MNTLFEIISHFQTQGNIVEVKPLGTGLINDSYKVETKETATPDYVLQRINHAIFQDVDMLQHNIFEVTTHIRKKLLAKGETDIDRKVLTLIPTADEKWYYFDGENYWRMTLFIADVFTYNVVNERYSFITGKAFGDFQSMLADIPVALGETIPNFHNMAFRLQQFHDAVNKDAAGRLSEIQPLVNEIEKRASEMCKAEQLYRDGKLPKRVCHCDTKVNNILFDDKGNVLCVIDLDTVMPSFIFSDYGDFLRTAANTTAEDDPDIGRVSFNMDIFKAFTQGYLEAGKPFLLPVEIENLPYAAALFPYMQLVRFLTDYINGDTYYKINCPEHNLIRSRNQLMLLQSVEEHYGEMQTFIMHY